MRVPDSPQRPLPALVGVPLSLIYRAAIRHINRRFDRGRGVVTFDRPVISVGNISVGGTGKSPMVALIVRWLKEAGHAPCIAMRGYGAGRGESDEGAAYRREFPDVPIVAQANRTLGLIRLFGREYDSDGPHSDCIVLDDGFQHRQIARALDIVLIDASRSPLCERLLPAGWLREPFDSIRRAGAVVITHAESAEHSAAAQLDQRIAAVRGTLADAVCRHAWTGLCVRRGESDENHPVSWLAGKRIIAVCAIGNPRSFLDAALASVGSGGAVVESFVLRDHDRYAPSTVQRISSAASEHRAHAIVTTDKDWSKLRHVRAWPCPVVRPRLELVFDRGADSLRAMVLSAASRPVPDADGQDQITIDATSPESLQSR